jgi:tellurite resistance protein TehA-like permease
MLQQIQDAGFAITDAAKRIGPDAGGVVMATGIVSVVLHLRGQEGISRTLLIATAMLWAVIAAAFLSRLWPDRKGWPSDARDPSSLTLVAGTAVLGSRFMLLGWDWAGWTLLVISTVLVLLLLPLVFGAWATPTAGASFLIVVAPQSLAVLAAQLARQQHLLALALASLTVFVIGLGLYATVAVSFDWGSLRTGAGDQWVAGGALAISALACCELAEASAAVRTLGDTQDALRFASVVLWALTIAWLAVLIAAELRWPRFAYDVRRWATVFPVGMYAAMSFVEARVNGDRWIGSFAQAWTWVAVAVWAAVSIGAVRRLASSPPRDRADKRRDR